ncbi:MAG: hypothetical protein JOY68_07190, partial [Candidatus Dormibacteraeota bacterium]|nr:hypothetical protein [Candidatus Dormibacteraeota bacterium]
MDGAGGVELVESTQELLAGVRNREPFGTVDALSGTVMERGVLDGAPVVIKHIDVDRDWIMRATGDIDCRLLRVISAGLLEQMPASID